MLCVMVLMRIYGSIAENALCNGFFRALMRIGESALWLPFVRLCVLSGFNALCNGSFHALMRIVWL